MSTRTRKPRKASATPTSYGPLLAELKKRVRAAQVPSVEDLERGLAGDKP